MEIRRAIFLRTHSLLGFLVSCAELGLSGFSNWQADKHPTIELTEESGE